MPRKLTEQGQEAIRVRLRPGLRKKLISVMDKTGKNSTQIINDALDRYLQPKKSQLEISIASIKVTCDQILERLLNE